MNLSVQAGATCRKHGSLEWALYTWPRPGHIHEHLTAQDPQSQSWYIDIIPRPLYRGKCMLTDQAGAQRVRWAPLADLNLLALGAGLIMYKKTQAL